MAGSSTNMGLALAVDADNSRTYLTNNLAATLNTIDVHTHAGVNSLGLKVAALENAVCTGTFNATGAALLNSLSVNAAATVNSLSVNATVVCNSLTVNGPAWTAWTPAVKQASAVNSTSAAYYYKLGKLCIVQAQITVTSAGANSNAIYVTVPAELSARANVVLGTAIVTDTGTKSYACATQQYNATTWQFVGYNAGDSVGVDPAFALANNDTIGIQAAYELA